MVSKLKQQVEVPFKSARSKEQKINKNLDSKLKKYQQYKLI